MKNPVTLAGIEPATFRFVAQRLNCCATAFPFTTDAFRSLRFGIDGSLISVFRSLFLKIISLNKVDVKN